MHPGVVLAFSAYAFTACDHKRAAGQRTRRGGEGRISERAHPARAAHNNRPSHPRLLNPARQPSAAPPARCAPVLEPPRTTGACQPPLASLAAASCRKQGRSAPPRSHPYTAATAAAAADRLEICRVEATVRPLARSFHELLGRPSTCCRGERNLSPRWMPLSSLRKRWQPHGMAAGPAPRHVLPCNVCCLAWST